MILNYVVTVDNVPVKEYFKILNFSRNFSKNIKLYGNIFINGRSAKNYELLHLNDVLQIEYNEKSNSNIIPTTLELDIVYEDEYLLILNKNANISVQPSRKYPINNVISSVKGYLKSKGFEGNIHVINRLDYSTSGLMAIGKSGFIHQQLQNKITRKYLCLVNGFLDRKEGTIDLPIQRCEAPSILRKIDATGQRAITHYKVLKECISNYGAELSLLEVCLDTGRTHQIRLHMASISHPVLFDKLYGVIDSSENNDDLRLHSYYISFIHPMNGKIIEVINYPKWYKEDYNA